MDIDIDLTTAPPRSPVPIDDFGNAIYPLDAWLRMRGLATVEAAADVA